MKYFEHTYCLQLMIVVQGVRYPCLYSSHVQAAAKGHHKKKGQQLWNLLEGRDLVNAAQLPIMNVEQSIQLPEILSFLQGLKLTYS